MAILFLIVLAICGSLLAAGIAMLRVGLRRRRDRTPDAPAQAQVVTGDHSPIETGDHSPIETGDDARTVGKVLAVITGTALIGGALAVFAGFIDLMQNGLGFNSKGRILRLRGKAQLPEVTSDDGWSDGASPAVDGIADDERRAVAACWLVSAQMEHASVAAFAQLSLHLAALGAPSDLTERTHRAALDEIRHARRCYALASAFAGGPLGAGPILALAQPPDPASDRPAIDLVRLAVGSLVDGALAEGIAADVARRAGDAARDPVVRQTLTMIAGDEDRHAELAWSVLGWCLDRGGEPVRAAVHARAVRLGDELAPAGVDLGGIDADRLAGHGLLTTDAIGAIAVARIGAVRDRALVMAAPLALAA